MNTIFFSVGKISFIFLMTPTDSTNDQNICVDIRLRLPINDQAMHQRKKLRLPYEWMNESFIYPRKEVNLHICKDEKA